MKRACTSVLSGLLAVLLAVPACALSYGDTISRSTYWYDENANVVPIPDVYTYQSLNTLVDLEGETCNTPVDMQATDDGLYVLDSGNGTLYTLSEELKTLAVLSVFYGEDGQPQTLSKPEGFFIDSEGLLYVADTGNARVLKCTLDGQILAEYGRPEGMLETEAAYQPTKIVVDSAGRMYVISKDINYGIISMDINGDFVSFVGAPKASQSWYMKIWQAFSSEEQIARMDTPTSTEYSSLLIDSSNFLYGTISSIKTSELEALIQAKGGDDTVTPVRKLSTAGDDILRRKGSYPPVGDLQPDAKGEYSRIVDIALDRNGVYSLLDSNRGRIFTYDNDGNLLFAFGETGSQKGALQRPVAIAYFGDRILVLDSVLRAVACYQKTDYGRMLLKAVYNQYEGNSESAYSDWAEIVRYNSNYKFAYIGLGQSLLKAGDYENAMAYFEYADVKEDYSQAFEQQRKIDMGYTFQYIFIAAAVLILVLAFYKKIRALWRYIRGVHYEE